MKILFFDKNKEACEAIKNLKLKDVKIKNCDLANVEADAVSTCSNPDYDFAGGIDAAIAKRFKLEPGGEWLEIKKGDKKIKNVVLNETVDSNRQADYELVRKAYANFFNVSKNNNWDIAACCGFGIGVGGLSVEDMRKAFSEAYRMWKTSLGEDKVKMINIRNLVLNDCHSAQMKNCDYAQMKTCNSAQMKTCHYAQMENCNFAQMKTCNSAQMENCNSAQMEFCNSAQMKTCNSAQMKNCYSAQMKTCNFAQMENCYSAQMKTCYEVFALECNGELDYCYSILHNCNFKEKNKKREEDFDDIFLHQFQQGKKHIAYKFLTKDWAFPINDKKIKYEKGKVYEEKCDKDTAEDCSYGINLASLLWCEKEKEEEDKIVEFEFDVKDAVVPKNTDGKFRVLKCKCIGLYKEAKDDA